MSDGVVMNGARPFDLAALRVLEKRQEDGISVRIKDPRGIETDWVVYMAGPDSKRVAAARHRFADARIKAEKLTISAAELEQQTTEIIGEAILGWNDKLMDGDKVVEFNPESLRAVLASRMIVEQLSVAINNRGLFIGS